MRNDVVIYDPDANTWETVIEQDDDFKPALQEFCNTPNTSAIVNADHIVFLATIDEESKVSKLMEFKDR